LKRQRGWREGLLSGAARMRHTANAAAVGGAVVGGVGGLWVRWVYRRVDGEGSLFKRICVHCLPCGEQLRCSTQIVVIVRITRRDDT
jgi:hypothetical protein